MRGRSLSGAVQAKFNIMRKAETNCNDARRFLFLPSPRSDLLHSWPPSVYKAIVWGAKRAGTHVNAGYIGAGPAIPALVDPDVAPDIGERRRDHKDQL